MTPECAVDILCRITYRPGWVIKSYSVPTGVVFRAGCNEPNAYREGAEDPAYVPVVYTWTISKEELGHMHREALLRWAFDIIAKRVLHEVEEWVKLDGVRIYQPHPGRGTSILGPGTSTPT